MSNDNGKINRVCYEGMVEKLEADCGVRCDHFHALSPRVTPNELALAFEQDRQVYLVKQAGALGRFNSLVRKAREE